MMKIRALIAVGVVAVFALIVVSCAQSSPPAEKSQPAAGQAKPTVEAAKSAEQTKPTAAPKTSEGQKPAPSATKPSEAAKPKGTAVVRAALQGQSSDAAAFIAEAKGYFKEQGIQFEHVQIGAPAEMVPLVATSQVDVAGVMGNVGYYNALLRGARMKGVADKGSLSKGNGFIALIVRKELVDKGRYKTPADLKGLKVALTPPPKSSVNAYNLYVLLKKAGLTMDDPELVGIQLADMPAALAGGSIDAGVSTEPYVSKAVEMGVAVRAVGFDEVNPGHQLTGISYSETFMRDRPDVAKRFMVAYVKGARDYNDAFAKNKNKAEIIKLLTQTTTLKDAAVWEKMVPPGLNPDGYLNVESLTDQMNWLLETGQIKEKPADYIDNQYVDYAISVLGKYQ